MCLNIGHGLSWLSTSFHYEMAILGSHFQVPYFDVASIPVLIFQECVPMGDPQLLSRLSQGQKKNCAAVAPEPWRGETSLRFKNDENVWDKPSWWNRPVYPHGGIWQVYSLEIDLDGDIYYPIHPVSILFLRQISSNFSISVTKHPGNRAWIRQLMN